MQAHDHGERPGTPASVFQTLAHPIRVRALVQLGRADSGLVYDRLRRRVDVRDNGKFNYHLNELRDRFVEQRADRYHLTSAGRRAFELLVAGTLGTTRPSRSFETPSDCLECGGRLEASYDGVTFRLDCSDCGSCVRAVRFPPGAVSNRGDEALLDAVDTVVRQRLSSLRDGVCPRCSGHVSTDLTTDGWRRDGEPRTRSLGVEHHCRDCRGGWTTTVGEAVIDHPAVVAFYHDHGVDIREPYVWELEFAATDHDTRCRSRDPLRVELRPQCGNDELVLVVDADGEVVRNARHTKFTARDTWFDRPIES